MELHAACTYSLKNDAVFAVSDNQAVVRNDLYIMSLEDLT